VRLSRWLHRIYYRWWQNWRQTDVARSPTLCIGRRSHQLYITVRRFALSHLPTFLGGASIMCLREVSKFEERVNTKHLVTLVPLLTVPVNNWQTNDASQMCAETKYPKWFRFKCWRISRNWPSIRPTVWQCVSHLLVKGNV